MHTLESNSALDTNVKDIYDEAVALIESNKTDAGKACLYRAYHLLGLIGIKVNSNESVQISRITQSILVRSYYWRALLLINTKRPRLECYQKGKSFYYLAEKYSVIETTKASITHILPLIKLVIDLLKFEENSHDYSEEDELLKLHEELKVRLTEIVGLNLSATRLTFQDNEPIFLNRRTMYIQQDMVNIRNIFVKQQA